MASSTHRQAKTTYEDVRSFVCDSCAKRVSADKPASLRGWYVARPLLDAVNNDPRDTESHFCPDCWR